MLKTFDTSVATAFCDIAMFNLTTAYNIMDGAESPYAAEMLFHAVYALDRAQEAITSEGLS